MSATRRMVVPVRTVPGLVSLRCGRLPTGLPALELAGVGRYHIERAGAPTAAGTEPMTVVGRHCEAGDVLGPDARLPADLRPGDLLTVPCAGAYHHAMASNYNHLTRPPVIAVHEGQAWPHVLRREAAEDMLRRDVG